MSPQIRDVQSSESSILRLMGSKTAPRCAVLADVPLTCRSMASKLNSEAIRWRKLHTCVACQPPSRLAHSFVRALPYRLSMPPTAPKFEPREVAAQRGRAEHGIRVMPELWVRYRAFDGDLGPGHQKERQSHGFSISSGFPASRGRHFRHLQGHLLPGWRRRVSG